MASTKGCSPSARLYYSKEHSWARFEDDGSVRIGVDDFYQREVGPVEWVTLPFEGDQVSQGELCGRIFSAGYKNRFCSPVSGEVVGVNKTLMGHGVLVNEDPYGRGWIALVRPSDIDADLRNLLHGEKALEWLRNEIRENEAKKVRCPSCRNEMMPAQRIESPAEDNEGSRYFCSYCFTYTVRRKISRFCIGRYKSAERPRPKPVLRRSVDRNHISAKGDRTTAVTAKRAPFGKAKKMSSVVSDGSDR